MMRFNWTRKPEPVVPQSAARKAYRNAVAGALMVYQSSTVDPSAASADAMKALEKQVREYRGASTMSGEARFNAVFGGGALSEKHHDKAIFAARAALREIASAQYISTAEARERYYATLAAAEGGR